MNTIQEKEFLRAELKHSNIPFKDRLLDSDSAIEQLYNEATTIEKVPNFNLYMLQFGKPEFDVKGGCYTEKYRELYQTEKNRFSENLQNIKPEYHFYNLYKVPTIKTIVEIDKYIRTYILNFEKIGDVINDETDHNRHILSLVNKTNPFIREIIIKSFFDYQAEIRVRISNEKDFSLIDSKINNLILFIQKESKKENKNITLPIINKNIIEPDFIWDNYNNKAFKCERFVFNSLLVNGIECGKKIKWIYSTRQGKPNIPQLKLFIEAITGDKENTGISYIKKVFGLEVTVSDYNNRTILNDDFIELKNNIKLDARKLLK